jgi:hypothetical protein
VRIIHFVAIIVLTAACTLGGYFVGREHVKYELREAMKSAPLQTVKFLTPTEDSCGTFVTAMNTADATKLAALAGWALGFLSGVAKGSDIDILRPMTAQDVMVRLYKACEQQPTQLFSVVVELTALSLIASQRRQ